MSVILGAGDESLALFGFGIDSFVEVLSGAAVLHMVLRIKKSGESSRDRFERVALRVTSISFYILAAGLTAGAVLTAVSGRKPETTFWGLVISLVSLLTMVLLYTFKMRTGRSLQSDALIADAACTKTCLYLSVVLLVSSALYEWLKIGYIDSAGALLIAWFAFSEGREAWGKADGRECSCGGKDTCSGS